jgi:hypothetical protein
MVISTHATAAEAFEALEYLTQRLQRFTSRPIHSSGSWWMTSGDLYAGIEPASTGPLAS